MNRMQRLGWSLFLAAALLQPLAYADTHADDSVMLNFSNADIESTIRAVGAITGHNFVIDPRVKGTINIVSSNPVSKKDVYAILLSALRLQGFTAIDSHGMTKILPEADAKQHDSPISNKSAPSGDQIVTQIYPLQHESAAGLVPILRPLITPNNTISAYANSNTLVITDYADNIRRLNRIIAAIDQPQDNLLLTIPLKYGSALDMATLVAKLMPDLSAATMSSGLPPQQQQQLSSDGTRKSIILPDLRTNSLIVRGATSAQLEQVRKLVEQLDIPIQGSGNIRVVYLKNAEASKLVQTLRAVLTGSGGGGSEGSSSSSNNGFAAQNSTPFGGNSGSTGGSNAASTTPNFNSTSSSTAGASLNAGGAIIQADPTTNSLVINAPEPVYNNLRAIIEKLDVRRAQVYVEAMIAEVNANISGEFGIQWLLGGSGSQVSGFATSSLAPSSSSNNILSVATSLAATATTGAAPAIGNGLNLGLLNGSLTGSGKPASLGVLASMLAGTGKANVLSTPTLLALDNEEAKIVVGQNLPFITGTQASTGSNPNPFTTIDRQDVGITLQIKPQISEGGALTLQVYEEVSSVDNTVNTGNAGIATKKRSITSRVLVDDGQIIVLGGLIEDDTANTVNKVPFLGDLPFIGNFFRYETRAANKTNLMIFLRPTILRDGPAAAAFSGERYDQLRNEQKNATLPETTLLPAVPAVILPDQHQKAVDAPMDNAVAPASAANATPANATPQNGAATKP